MKRRMALEISAILTVTGALAGFVTAQLLPRRYISRTAVAFTEKVSTDRCIYAANQTLSAPALKPIVVQNAYYRTELDFTAEEDIVERIQQNGSIRCDVVSGQNGFRVEFTDDDRYLSLEMARILVEETGKNALAAMRVVEPVQVGTTGPGRAQCVLIGMVCCLALGLIAIGFAGVSA